MIVAGTGHRRIEHSVRQLVDAIRVEFLCLAPSRVISGMALGWDMALAEAAVEEGVPFVAAVPFPEQTSLWPPDQQARHESLLSLAAEVVVVAQCLSSAAYEKRNRWMIDRADLVLSYWDGSLTGGTSNAVRYADRRRVAMRNMFGRI
jgi:uncharacterized phage-like protein YoqJ